MAMLAVFTVFFGRLARFATGDTPYYLFALAALLPWQMFSKLLGAVSTSVVRDQRLVTKVYFPRLLMPIASTFSALVDFAITLVLFVVVVAIAKHSLLATIAWVPVLTVLTLALALGVGLWLAAVNVQYRDVQQIIPFLIQLWFFLSPIVYPVSLLPAPYRPLYVLNPMVGIIETFRWALLGVAPLVPYAIWVSAAAACIALTSGIVFFHSRQARFVDVLG